MDMSQDVSLDDYKKFWTTSLACSPSAAAPFQPCTRTIAWLLTFDGSLRSGTSPASASGPQVQQQQQWTLQNPGERALSALHFMSLFWDRDSGNSQFIKALEAWCANVSRSPRPDDCVWHVTDEIIPALKSGGSSSIWNYTELCCGSSLFLPWRSSHTWLTLMLVFVFIFLFAFLKELALMDCCFLSMD